MSTTEHNEIQEELDNESVVLEKAYRLRSFAISEGASEDFFEDIIESGPHEQFREAHPRLWALSSGDDVPEKWEAADALADMRMEDGFVWQFTTPVRHYSTNTGWHFSWGHTTWVWVYAKSYEDACVAALKWFHDMDAKWRPQPPEQGQ